MQIVAYIQRLWNEKPCSCTRGHSGHRLFNYSPSSSEMEFCYKSCTHFKRLNSLISSKQLSISLRQIVDATEQKPDWPSQWRRGRGVGVASALPPNFSLSQNFLTRIRSVERGRLRYITLHLHWKMPQRTSVASYRHGKIYGQIKVWKWHHFRTNELLVSFWRFAGNLMTSLQLANCSM